MNDIPQTTIIHCQDPEKRRDIVVSDSTKLLISDGFVGRFEQEVICSIYR